MMQFVHDLVFTLYNGKINESANLFDMATYTQTHTVYRICIVFKCNPFTQTQIMLFSII